jgi:FAD/FMN-containing dehydrogenase
MSQTPPERPAWSRRGFLGAVAILGAGCGVENKTPAPALSGFESWRNAYPGRVIARDDANYEHWRTGMPWQTYTAPRHPQLIVRPYGAQGVIRAVEHARKEGLKIAIKSGGHNVSGAFLRDDTLLLDLGELQGIAVDVQSRSAWVEPALWSHALMQAIQPHGLAFPVAHCATVPMGGYLLGGGVGLNGDEWGGMACHNILAAEVVLASGEKILASPDSHPDVYWAVRGAGTGFFGVVTRLQLRLHPLPRSIYENGYVFPLSRLAEVSRMLADIATTAGGKTELMMLLAHNPMAPPDASPLDRKMAALRVIAYADSEDEAKAILAPAAAHPNAAQALVRNEMVPNTFDRMAADSVNARMGLGFGRYAVDTVWTGDVEATLAALAGHFAGAPSSNSHIVVSPRINRTLHEDAAFSMIGDNFVGAYGVWKDSRQDAENFAWLAEAAELMAPHREGQYINEVDGFRDPATSQRCFSPEVWARLRGLRRQYDPDGLFIDFPGTS